MSFTLLSKSTECAARRGTIHTPHGDIQTPIFMPVGTQATVKTLDTQDLEKSNAQIILGNTYHLHLRPGENVIAEFGGLHTFMGWNKPILTDSGGFQVFSLGAQKEAKESNDGNHNQEKLVKIDDEGVDFRSYIDGSLHRFTPEIAIDIQHKIGADIIMAFDECTPDSASAEYAQKALERTHAWAKRCVHYHKKQHSKQLLFGIIQGGTHKELREESARAITSLDFDGIAIGGESIGYNMAATKDILDWVMPYIPENKPRYTMGVGLSPLDLFAVVEQGVDMFDCVSPTRLARNGTLYICPEQKQKLGAKKLQLTITNAQFATDKNPIDADCSCFTCTHHSRAYLHHLFKAEELLAYRLATIHNVHFFLNLMQQMRDAIENDTFIQLKKKWLN